MKTDKKNTKSYTKSYKSKKKNQNSRINKKNKKNKNYKNYKNYKKRAADQDARVKGSDEGVKSGFVKTAFNDYSNKKFSLLAGLFVFIFTFSVFLNNIHNKFTNWDDPALILNNQSIRSLDFDNIVKIFTPVGGTFQPVRVLSYAIDYSIDKFNPVVFHLHNNILHALAAVFLFFMLQQMLPYLLPGSAGKTAKENDAVNKSATRTEVGTASCGSVGNKVETDNICAFPVWRIRAVALMTALLFAVHPVNVEAVTWLAGRKYTLLALFFFLSAYLLVKSYEAVSTRAVILYSAASFLCAGLSVLSSPFGVVIPVVLFMFDYCRDENINPFKVLKKRIRYHSSYLILFAFLVPVLAKGLSGKQYYMNNPLYTIWSMIRCLFEYAKNFICPIWLNARYVDLVCLSPWDYRIIISICVLVLILMYIIIRFRKKDRFPLFCFGWLFIVWAPVSNVIIPISTTMADRYVYLPGVGLFLFFAGLLTGWPENCGQNSLDKDCKKQRKSRYLTIFIVLCVIIAACSVLTFRRNRVWADSKTLWLDSIKGSSGFVNKVAYTNLAKAYMDKGNYKLAAGYLEAVVKIDPDFILAVRNLGYAYLKMGRYNDGVKVLESIISSGYGEVKTYYNLGLCYLNLHKMDKAKKNFKKAVSLKPDYADAWNNLGLVFYRQHYYSSAAKNFSRAISLSPELAEAYCNMGLIQQKQGNIEKAVSFFKKALHYQPDFPEARRNIMILQAVKGNLQDAIVNFKELLKLTPNDAKLHTDFGSIYARAGKFKEAARQYRIALKLEPSEGQRYYNLGTALMLMGNNKEAESYMNDALKYRFSDFKVFYCLGRIKFNQRLFKDAAENYRRAIAMKPDCEACCSGLGSALFRMGDLKGALNEFQRALILKPHDSADIHYQMANIFFAMKNFREGVKHLRAVLKINPNYSAAPMIRKQLAEFDNDKKGNKKSNKENNGNNGKS